MSSGQLGAEVPAEETPATDRPPAPGWQSSPARVAVIAFALAAVAVVLWGGYGRHWSWTGINGGTATLWDWLHLLLLPLLLPTLVVPSLRPMVAASLIAAEETEASGPESDAGGGENATLL